MPLQPGAFEGGERAMFLDYLTAHFGPARDGGPSRPPFFTQPQRRNPFATD